MELDDVGWVDIANVTIGVARANVTGNLELLSRGSSVTRLRRRNDSFGFSSTLFTS